MTTTPDDWSELSKKVRCAALVDRGYGLNEAADKVGYSGRPPKSVRQIVDVLDGDDPTVDVEATDKREALGAYRETDQEIARLEWELAQMRRKKQAIRARLAVCRDEHLDE